MPRTAIRRRRKPWATRVRPPASRPNRPGRHVMELDEAADGVEDDEAHAREELRRIVGHHAAARRIGYQIARARPIPEQHPRRSPERSVLPPARAAMRLGPLREIGRNRELSCAIGPGFFIAEA